MSSRENIPNKVNNTLKRIAEVIPELNSLRNTDFSTHPGLIQVSLNLLTQVYGCVQQTGFALEKEQMEYMETITRKLEMAKAKAEFFNNNHKSFQDPPQQQAQTVRIQKSAPLTIKNDIEDEFTHMRLE